MTNRYVTEAEKEGTRRRMEEYRLRLSAAGIKTRAYQLNEAEHEAVKKIIEVWRADPSRQSMDADQLIQMLKS